jgi:Zn-dependent peptidase ImmA (M78 family)
MRLRDRLKTEFQTDSILDACNKLVVSVFPTHVASAGPLNLENLAASVGISIKYVSTPKFDGKFEVDHRGKPVITLSKLGNRCRSRFTLAHEIGHWLLREAGKSDSRTSFRGYEPRDGVDREEELIANMLAAELLMPLQRIYDLARDSAPSLRLMKAFARSSQVSFFAAMHRFADVTSIPFLYMNVVPNRFKLLDSHAEVDDAVFVTPTTGIRRDRERTRLANEYAFSRIKGSRHIQLVVSSSEEKLSASFEVLFNQRPIPNCDLLADLSRAGTKNLPRLQPTC